MCQKPHYCKSQTDLEVQCNQFKLQQTFEMKLTRFFFFLSFILFLREIETAQVGEGLRERETKNPKQVPRCQHGAR